MKIQTFSIIAGTAACNAHCPYCISRQTGIRNIGYQETKINTRNLKKACRLAQLSGVTTVLFTGKGEPTLYPKQISKFLNLMKSYDFPIIEIQTNGLKLPDSAFTKHLKDWYDKGMSTIAISIAHYQNERNKEIFCPTGKYPDLKTTIEKLHNIGFSVRLSCLLMRGFIDSIDETNSLTRFAKENRVEQLTIRKLGIEPGSEDDSQRKYSSEHALKQDELDKIKGYLDSNARKLMTLSHGAVVYELEGQNICFTDCQMLKPDSEEIRTLIYFPDGHLRYNWEFGGAIIL